MFCTCFEIMMSLKYLGFSWIPLINCEINLIPSWYDQYFTCSNVLDVQVTILTIPGANLYVPVVTAKLKLGFIRSIN